MFTTTSPYLANVEPESKSPITPTRNSLTSPEKSEENAIPYVPAKKRGCLSTLFCGCSSTDPVEEERQYFIEQIQPLIDEIENERIKIKEILRSSSLSAVANIIYHYCDDDVSLSTEMAMIGKITTKMGDSAITYVGDEVARKLNYSPENLTGLDISRLLNPHYAPIHKKHLADFVTSRLSPVANVNALQIVTEAPRGLRPFLLIGGDGSIIDASFRLKTFCIGKHGIKNGDKKYLGVYTVAFFSEVKKAEITSLKVENTAVCPFTA